MSKQEGPDACYPYVAVSDILKLANNSRLTEDEVPSAVVVEDKPWNTAFCEHFHA